MSSPYAYFLYEQADADGLTYTLTERLTSDGFTGLRIDIDIPLLFHNTA